jgi:hypothetical protein
MRTIKAATFDALMAELRVEFANGKVYQAEIHSDGELVEGLYEPSSGSVYVDPAPNVVDTLLHELLHRRYPRWGERRVSDTARRLVTAMSDEERRWWYRAYRRVAKRRRPVKVEIE